MFNCIACFHMYMLVYKKYSVSVTDLIPKKIENLKYILSRFSHFCLQ